MKKFLVTLLSIATIFSACTMTVFAEENEENKQEATQAEQSEKEETKTYDWASNTTGNSTLISDQNVLIDNGEYQFIAVSTYTDDVFYIIIDKTKTEDNVYFLNEVDTFDIQKLLSDDSEDSTVEVTGVSSRGEDIEKNTEPQESESSADTSTDMSKNILYLILGGVGIIACVVVFIFVSKKKPTKPKGEEFDDDFLENTINEDEE